MANPYDNPSTPEEEEADNPYADVTDESGGDIAGTQAQQDLRLDDLETNQSSLQTSMVDAESDIDVLETEMDTAQADIIHLEEALTNAEVTGFVNQTDSTMSFTEGTRTFSIAPTATYFDVWQNGIKYTKTAEETLVITDVEGVHFIYYNLGVLTDIVNPTNSEVGIAIRTLGLVMYIYWDATNKKGVYVGEERHGLVMDGDTHALVHFKEGMSYITGLAPTDILVDEDGSSDTHAQVGTTLGLVMDEDISVHISAIASTTGYRVMYRDGVNGYWRHEDVSGFPMINASAGRPYWNEYTGGSWQRTETSDRDFMLVHIFASTSIDDPIFIIMGQNEYGNKGDARDGALVELDSLLLDISLTAEIKSMASIIVQCRSSYGNAVKARFVSTDDGDDFIDYRTVRGAPSGGTSSGSGALDYGTPTNIGREYIDGSTNAKDTDITIVDTTTSHYEEVDVVCVNTNPTMAVVRMAHIPGAVSALGVDDYLWYEVDVLPNESKNFVIPGFELGHSIMVRSSAEDVNFLVTGRLITAPTVKRLGSIDIDGTTNAVSTNIEVVTSLVNYTELIFQICNRNGGTASKFYVYKVDSTSIGDLADEDLLFSGEVVDFYETITFDDFSRDFPLNNMITFQSEEENVNIIVYGREV